MKFQDRLRSFLVALLDLPLVSKAMASSSIVRDAVQLYISLAHELLQSIPDNQNENDLTFERSRKTIRDETNDEEHEQLCKGELWGAGGLLWWIRPVCHHCAQPALTAETTMKTKKQENRKKWKIQTTKQKNNWELGFEGIENVLKREFCEEEEGWKSFNLQNISKAGLGEEQNENDSLEIAAETERTEQRRLSFYWTRTYCKTICGPNSNEDEHIVKLFSRSQINAFVCWLHVFLFHLINIRWKSFLYFPFDVCYKKNYQSPWSSKKI